MSALVIDKNKCVGCGLCVRTCPSNALKITSKKAEVNDNCVLCGICIDSCKFGAIAIQKSSVPSLDTSAYSGIWVFAQQQEGELLPLALELLGKGSALAVARGCKLTAVLLGENMAEQAKTLVAYGADRVFVCDDPLLNHPMDEPYCNCITQLIDQYKPEVLLFGATNFGRSLAPRVAARVQTGLTADCTSLEINSETGLLEQTRPAFGGNLMATIVCPAHRPQMATVRSGVMESLAPDYTRKGEVISVELPYCHSYSCELLDIIPAGASNSIADAEVIVCAGRGIGSQKNMALVRELAKLLGAEVGVTRGLVDNGWGDPTQQIGQTGFAVAPKLLISCGVSGAIQHLAGIGGAKAIIAINSDPEAPIFASATYSVVGDCTEVLKELIAKIKAKKY